MSDVALLPDYPLDRVSGIVVHQEIDDVRGVMSYSKVQEHKWEALAWHSLGLPPPSEPAAPIASRVYLVNTLEERRRTERRVSGDDAS